MPIGNSDYSRDLSGGGGLCLTGLLGRVDLYQSE